MDGFIKNLNTLGKTRLMILGAAGIAIVLAVLFVFNVLSKPAMNTLYSGLDPSESAQVARIVEQLSVPYEMSGDGTAISVPRSEFGRVRMALAENGLPSQGGMGYEIFDEGGNLGMTSFMQKVNRLRALEGELARTVQTVQGIHAARVHLVLPDREAFAREAPTPTGSVVIRTSAGFALERSQALAIRHLVAAAVPNLQNGSVTVMDTTGRLLLAEESAPGEGDGGGEGLKASIENRIAGNLEKLLSARVGAGNVRVQVSAELDLSRQTERTQSFDPEEQVVRSTQLVEEDSQDQSTDANVSVEENLPMMGIDEAPGSQSASTRLEETINYEISNTLIENVVEPGQISRLSVAVLVNGEYVDDNGQSVYQDRSPEEVERIEELVQSAVGYNDARGDDITVDSMQFIDYAMDVGEPVGVNLKNVFADNMMDIIRWLVALAALSLLVFAFRPMIMRLLPEKASSSSVAGSEAQSGGAEDGAEGESTEAADVGDAPQAAGDGDTGPVVSIQQVSGNIQASKINQLSDIIDTNQDQAVKVLKSWLAKE